jgi:hypothetical protein
VFVAEVRHDHYIEIKRERGSHRHTSFGVQQGVDAKTNNHKGGYNTGLGWERESVCSFSY